MTWPDYHPEFAGARSSGRMLEPRLHDRTRCGEWAGRIRPAPVLSVPITLQESTVDWKPAYFPERLDMAMIAERMQQGLVACGQALIAALLEGCLERGVEIVMGSAPRRLVRSGDRVTGVLAEEGGGTTTYEADAVILATGGFEWNEDLKRQFLVGPLTHPNSPPVNEGDGLLMAMDAGAALGNMIEAWWYPAAAIPGEEYDGRQLARFVGTERTAPHSIMVNRRGERFVDEAANYNDMQKAFYFFDANDFDYRNIPCWVVFDGQYRRRYGVLSSRPDGPRPRVAARRRDAGRARDPRAGIDPDGLARTVERFNGFVAAERDADFGRGDSAYDRFHGDPSAPHPNLGTIAEPPYYALPGAHGRGRDQGRADRRRARPGDRRAGRPDPRPLCRRERDGQPRRPRLLRRGVLDRDGHGVGLPRRGARDAALAPRCGAPHALLAQHDPLAGHLETAGEPCPRSVERRGELAAHGVELLRPRVAHRVGAFEHLDAAHHAVGLSPARGRPLIALAPRGLGDRLSFGHVEPQAGGLDPDQHHASGSVRKVAVELAVHVADPVLVRAREAQPVEAHRVEAALLSLDVARSPAAGSSATLPRRQARGRHRIRACRPARGPAEW